MELIELIKMLFTSPKDTNKLVLKGMKNYPFKGYKYMMWCGHLIYRGNIEPTVSTTSMTHETIHLQQAKIKGSWVKYYWSYLVEWLKGNPIINPSSSAYYTIPYEIEAYANESNKNYIATKDSIKKYYLKNRKKVYLDNRKNWKQWIKTII